MEQLKLHLVTYYRISIISHNWVGDSGVYVILVCMCVAPCSACSLDLLLHIRIPVWWLLPSFVSQEVLEHTQMSGEMFTLYLHQNYVDFFTDMDDIVSCTVTAPPTDPCTGLSI